MAEKCCEIFMRLLKGCHETQDGHETHLKQKETHSKYLFIIWSREISGRHLEMAKRHFEMVLGHHKMEGDSVGKPILYLLIHIKLIESSLKCEMI